MRVDCANVRITIAPCGGKGDLRKSFVLGKLAWGHCTARGNSTSHETPSAPSQPGLEAGQLAVDDVAPYEQSDQNRRGPVLKLV